MNEVLFKIVLALISILCTILTGVVVPYIKEKIGNEKLAKYEEWATLGVQCAEMIFKGQGMGANKKEYVVNFLNEMFNENEIVITEKQLEILIESAVKQMKIEEN
jgi:LL-H family phage holin